MRLAGARGGDGMAEGARAADMRLELREGWAIQSSAKASAAGH